MRNETHELFRYLKTAAEQLEQSEQRGYHANTAQNAPSLTAQQQQGARPTNPYRPVKYPNVPQVGESEMYNQKMASSQAFDEAYEYTIQKIAASCCGGRGGQTMIKKHGGGKVMDEDFGRTPDMMNRTYSNAILNRDVDDAMRIGGRGKRGFTVKIYDPAIEKKYRSLLAERGLKSAPDMDTYYDLVHRAAGWK